MIVAIHRPALLPWLGYLHRMLEADLFGADVYLSGMGGSLTYVGRADLARAGIERLWQETGYPRPQPCGDGLLTGSSASDRLANPRAQGRALYSSRGGSGLTDPGKTP